MVKITRALQKVKDAQDYGIPAGGTTGDAPLFLGRRSREEVLS